MHDVLCLEYCKDRTRPKLDDNIKVAYEDVD